MSRPSSGEVVIGVQARLYGPAHGAVDAARGVATGVGGFVVRVERLGTQLVAAEIELPAAGLGRLIGALDAAGLRHDLRAADLPAGVPSSADARCRLAIQVVSEEPDGVWEVPSVPG